MDWKRKFSSRKFWLAVAGFVAGILIYFGHSKEEANEVAGLIMAGGAVVAYILAEGWIDASNAGYIYPEEPDPGVDPEAYDGE